MTDPKRLGFDAPLGASGRRRHLLRNYALVTFISLFATIYTIRSINALGDSRNAKTARLNAPDPADEWQDNVYPIRQQTPWDISTDYPHPRKLEYDVTEGTWLRLDVHPKTGDIVFDMVGDIYCLPGKETAFGSRVIARPVLRGVPYDSDPRFSPTGDRIVFRSDAELGVENIWVTEWKGCEEMALKQGGMLEASDQETQTMRVDRLQKEGRFGAQRVTNETFRWVSDARFHPSGSKVIATKWYSSRSASGAGEGWAFSVPSLEDLRKGTARRVASGSGKRIISRTLPRGWTAQQYGLQQIGPEQFLYHGGDRVVFSKNVIDDNRFQYSKDVHRGTYAIFERNLTTGTTQKLVDALPGGASRPEISRDGRTLAFVRRVRDKQALVLKDLETGSIHSVWYGLTYDLTMISAPMGTYPSFAFAPRDDAVVIWAAGQIHRVPLAVNARGEKVAGSAPRPIPFTAHIEKRLAETLRGGDIDLVKLETAPTQRAQAFKELRVDETGGRAVFQAAGATYFANIDEKDVVRVSVLRPDQPYYSPSFVHGAPDLVLHARWSDTHFTTFEISDVASNQAYELGGLPMGRYFSPILCECEGLDRQIAFVKTGGDLLTGNVLATAKPGLYIGSLTLPSSITAKSGTSIPIRNVTYVRSNISPSDRLSMRFLERNKRLLVQQSSSSFIIDLAAGPDKHGNYPHQTLARGEMSTELETSVSKRDGSYGVDNVAFVDFFHVYVAPGSSMKDGEAVWSKPANATKGLARLSIDGGHDITWSGDGKKLLWFLGPSLFSIEVAALSQCAEAIKRDHLNFGIGCVKNLIHSKDIFIEHSTDISRLKEEANSLHGDAGSSDLLIVLNATILTMSTRNEATDLIERGVLVVRGGVIDAVSTLDSFTTPVPQGAMVIDAEGGYLIPGFVDVHAHWDGYEARYPAKSWEMETFLAYGITTMHNPSAANVLAPIERTRIESGQMIGPRIFTVGDVVFGGGIPAVHQEVVDLAEARSVLNRIRAEAGPFAISHKIYILPSRASRQRLFSVARNLSMLAFPEGGMNYDWDLTYILDGMTTIEHAIPVPTLYEDVLTLYALSGTGSTPTHIVNYGGAWGEQFVWATEDLPNDPKLRRFTRHDVLEALSESTARPKNSYALFNTSASVAAMVQKGLLANIGAHGEPPLGLNYHAEMEFTRAGGLTRYETLRAATIDGAKTIGLDRAIGSIEAGKLADFLIYPPGVDILREYSGAPFSTVGPTRDISLVARGGRIWNASTMEEVWPVPGRKQKMPAFNAN